MSRSSDQAEQVHVLTGEIKAETGKALLIHCTEIDGNPWDPETPKSHWIPYSQITTITKQAPESELPDSVTVKRWILQQKGLV